MNLVIVEDNELVLYQLLRLVATQSAINISGVAADEEAAITVITENQPDAVLLDLSLRDGTGIDVLKRMRASGSTARVLVLTNYTSEIVRRACESHGIDGFYDKSHESSACFDQLFSWVGK